MACNAYCSGYADHKQRKWICKALNKTMEKKLYKPLGRFKRGGIKMLEPVRDKNEKSTLADVIDRLLDKGLVINADIVVSVAGVELLGVKVRAALASFATAAKFGLEFPSGTNLETEAWKEAQAGMETCPQCGKEVTKEELLNECCPWCGWVSAKAEKKLKERELEGIQRISTPTPQK